MSITILSPYRLFFIDQSDFLFALMKDGRVIRIKKIPFFSTLSADFHTLSGVSFDGENTHIFKMPFGFNAQAKEELNLFGYFYYPAFSENQKKLALIEADLLNPRPSGELTIYKKKIKKWYKIKSLPAKMKAPIWQLKTDTLLFINQENQLVSLDGDTLYLIAEDVQLFSLCPNQKYVAYFSGNHIHIYHLPQSKVVESVEVSGVTALSLDLSGTRLFYATNLENRFAIYSVENKKTTLLTQTQNPVTFLSV